MRIFKLTDKVVLRIPENPATTLSPLHKGLESGIKELKENQEPNLILILATDEIIEPAPGKVVPNECISKFRKILTDNNECPWVFYFKDRSYYNGDDQSLYRIYFMIHYIPEEIELKQEEQVVNKFMKLLDTLSENFGRKAILHKFNYPERRPVFKAFPLMEWEEWESGTQIDSYYGFRLSYIPKTYKLIKGDFYIDKDDKDSRINVAGFKNKTNIPPYKVKLHTDEEDNIIHLVNIKRGGWKDIQIRFEIPTPAFTPWDILSFRENGRIDGNIVGKVSNAVFDPLQEDYPNLITSGIEDRIDGTTIFRVNIGYQYDVRYPSWVWPLRILLIFILPIIIVFLVIIFSVRSRRSVSEIKIEVTGASILNSVSKMDLKSENTIIISAEINGENTTIGSVQKRGRRYLRFLPEKNVNQKDGRAADTKWPVKKARRIDLMLTTKDGGSGNPVLLTFTPVSRKPGKNKGKPSSSNPKSNKGKFIYDDRSVY